MTVTQKCVCGAESIFRERQERWQANRATPPRVSGLRSGSPKGKTGKAVGGGRDLGVDPTWAVEKSYPYSHSQAF